MATNENKILVPESEKQTLAGASTQVENLTFSDAITAVPTPAALPAISTSITDGKVKLENYIRSALYGAGIISKKTWNDDYIEANKTMLSGNVSTSDKGDKKYQILSTLEKEKDVKETIDIVSFTYNKTIVNPLVTEQFTKEELAPLLSKTYTTFSAALTDLRIKQPDNLTEKAIVNFPAEAVPNYSPTVIYKIKQQGENSDPVYANNFGISPIITYSYLTMLSTDNIPTPVLSVDIRRPEYFDLNEMMKKNDSRFNIKFVDRVIPGDGAAIPSRTAQDLYVTYTMDGSTYSYRLYADFDSKKHILNMSLINPRTGINTDFDPFNIELVNDKNVKIPVTIKQEIKKVKSSAITYKAPTDTAPVFYKNYPETQLNKQSLCYKADEKGEDHSLMSLNFYFQERKEITYDTGIIYVINKRTTTEFNRKTIMEKPISFNASLPNIENNYNITVFTDEVKTGDITTFGIKVEANTIKYKPQTVEYIDLDLASNSFNVIEDKYLSPIYEGVVEKQDGTDDQLYEVDAVSARKFLALLEGADPAAALFTEYTSVYPVTHKKDEQGRPVMVSKLDSANTSLKVSWLELIIQTITTEVVRITKSYVETAQIKINADNITAIQSEITTQLIPTINNLITVIKQHEVELEKLTEKIRNDRLNINYLYDTILTQNETIKTLTTKITDLEKKVAAIAPATPPTTPPPAASI
jgi:hypothetical protein